MQSIHCCMLLCPFQNSVRYMQFDVEMINLQLPILYCKSKHCERVSFPPSVHQGYVGFFHFGYEIKHLTIYGKLMCNEEKRWTFLFGVSLIKSWHVVLKIFKSYTYLCKTYNVALAVLTRMAYLQGINVFLNYENNFQFLHDRSWISPWIKSISNELDITCHLFVSQLSGHCDVIANLL